MSISIRRVFLEGRTAVDEPPMDLYEIGEELILEMDLPGLEPDDVMIKIFGGRVVIEGARRGRRARPGAVQYHCLERPGIGCFRRVIELPVGVEAESARAVFRNGVLRLTFRKSIYGDVLRVRIIND